MNEFTMTIEKFPCTEHVHLTNKIRAGYRAHVRTVDGFNVVDYYGWGATRREAIAECVKQIECRHLFKGARGMRGLKKCHACGHLRVDN